MRLPIAISLLISVCFSTVSCGPQSKPVLRLATTTSTRDSGLLDELLPEFELSHGCRVDVVAVGTGAALKLGRQGDADVLIVHAPPAEEVFMQEGHGISRDTFMYNYFMIVGPQTDPAKAAGESAAKAMQKIAKANATFISRGDDSGTHKKERALWEARGGRPEWSEYLESGQGMGATLIMADESNAYTLTDGATYYKFQPKLDLAPLVESSDDLQNPYSVLVINPEKSPKIQVELAKELASYLISPSIQHKIAAFKLGDRSLFHPMVEPANHDSHD